MPTPLPMRHSVRRLSSRDRCAFHEDGEHKIDDCSSLKDVIKEAVKNGELKDFVAQGTDQSDRVQGLRPKVSRRFRGETDTNG
ncbi:hypothetical protein J1N35_037768 [Gossypium stocksii]|uniref:Uncharacterized protein n=1 Tax=Gossypium stocksii TaxID=47602 RepID=A0A9D3ZLZ8_9ROSI|nr:hypothetical protein J1N35_037768 [Gossypium stocksii]